MSEQQAVIKLVLHHPVTLDDVNLWASIAEQAGIPSGSAVEAGYGEITVAAWASVVRDVKEDS